MIVPKSPSSGATWAIVVITTSRRSIRDISAAAASCSVRYRSSFSASRYRIATFTRYATGPGVSSQSASASLILPWLSTLKIPFRKSLYRIRARCRLRERSMKTYSAPAPPARMHHETAPPSISMSKIAIGILLSIEHPPVV